MGHTHRYQFDFKKKKKNQVKSPSPECRVSKTGSDPPIGSDQDSGRDKGAKGSIPTGIIPFGAPKLKLRPKQLGLL